jgi:hypothetical protein
MRIGEIILLTTACLLLGPSVFAARITGKVTNGTTGKPAVGEEVVLLSLAQGMDETSRTKTGTDGSFTLDVTDEGAQHLVRVAHQGVNYFRPAPQGASTVDITIYDSAKSIKNLMGTGRVFRFQTSNKELDVSESYFLDNQSSPPRTWMDDHTFEISLPEGAKLLEGMASGPGGMPVASTPVPTGKPHRYAFVYPVRPGRTELRVIYTVPYTGTHDFNLAAPGMPLAEIGIMLPKSMSFKSSDSAFLPANEEDGMTVFVAKNVAPSQALSFTVSGEGAAPREAQGGGQTSETAAPGGGLGTPTGEPEPMGNARWYILGGVIVVMAVLVIWMVRRKHGTKEAFTEAFNAGREAVAQTLPDRPGLVKTNQPRSTRESQNTILDALKEELFQLETDKALGKISAQDYAAAKAGLDTLFRRHIKK